MPLPNQNDSDLSELKRAGKAFTLHIVDTVVM